MKRITDFIVQRRNIILVIFLLLAAGSVFLMQRVNINRDMTKYLPETSEVRVGLDTMTAEFGEAEESQLVVMLENLSDDEKTVARDYLAGLEQVSEVAYEATEEYERDGYTRFIVTVAAPVDSEIATAVYEEVEEHFKGDELALGGEIAEQNHEVLPVWIVAMAVGCALVILLVMSESYVEPFLFLATILIAVLLNKGTNIIFPSVSNITDSITAILQLALSMDYSIMLMNRYQQEKLATTDKVKAMKNALFHAFGAISSSSVTTIVGLLALVFMSFTIGQDMGFVLAKGVLFSLLTIFTCLPGLILLFERAIEKTKKKSPSVKLEKVGNIAYKCRYVGLGLFVLAFGASYVLQGGLGILYTDSEEDKISVVFGNDNQMAIIYQNEDEAKVAEYCRGLEVGGKLDEVLCYGNTINLDLTVEELPVKMDDLGVETELEDYLMRLVYYHYYRQGDSGRMKLDELVRFVENDIYTHEKFSEQIDAEMRSNITKLKNFASVAAVEQQRSEAELAEILGIESSKLHDLMVYYNSKQVTRGLTAQELTQFLLNYVVGTKYGASMDAQAVAQLRQLNTYTNKQWFETPRDAAGMAQALGMKTEEVEALYGYYGYLEMMKQMGTMADEMVTEAAEAANTEAAQVALPEVRLSPMEFVEFVLTHKDDSMLAGQFHDEAVRQLEFLRQLMADSLRERRYTTAEAAELLNMDETKVKLIYSLYETEYFGKTLNLSNWELVNFLLDDVVRNPEYAHNFDSTAVARLTAVRQVMQNTLLGVSYTPASLVATLSGLANELDQNLIELVYLYHGSLYNYDSSWQMTIEQFVNYIAGTLLNDARFDDFIDGEMREEVAEAESEVAEAKAMLVGENFSRVVLNTSFEAESEETFSFIESLHEKMAEKSEKFYIVGDSAMAYEMSQSFGSEMNMITVLTMLFIFVVVALTFGSVLLPLILVLLIQCAVYLTMSIMSMSGEPVYFIAILIVQSILMGATIDYAILYTSYYIEAREKLRVKAAVGQAYTRSIHAIATSSLILILVTLIVGNCTSGITAKILLTLAEGTTCATVLILVLLPAVLAACDKLIMRRKTHAD